MLLSLWRGNSASGLLLGAREYLWAATCSVRVFVGVLPRLTIVHGHIDSFNKEHEPVLLSKSSEILFHADHSRFERSLSSLEFLDQGLLGFQVFVGHFAWNLI